MKQLNTRMVEKIISIQILENGIPLDFEWNNFSSFSDAIYALNSDWINRRLDSEYTILTIKETRKLTFFE